MSKRRKKKLIWELGFKIYIQIRSRLLTLKKIKQQKQKIW